MGCTASKEQAMVVEAPNKPTAAELLKQENEKKRLERIGVSAEPLPDFVPNPGGEKWKNDKKGESVCVFTAIMPSETYAEMLRKPMSQPEICAKIITLINDLYPLAMLDLEYTMPKIHAGYMGDEIDLISSDSSAPATAPAGFVNPGTATATATTATATTASVSTAAPAVKETAKPVLVNPHITLQRSQAEERARLVHVPPKMQGWLKKKGHIVVNWKTRYFVLDSGYLTYFVDQLDVPPFGKDKKGQISLAGFRVEQYKPIEGSQPAETQVPSEQLYRIQLILTDDSYQVRAGKPSDYQELALEAASLEEKLAWLAAINAHTHYIESSLKIAAQVEQQAAAAAVAKNTASAAVTAPVSTASVAPATTTAATSTTDSAATVAGAVASGSTKELPVPPTPNVSVNTPSAAALSLAAATATPAAATATTPATSAPAPALPAAPSVTATNDPKPWMVYVDASLQETIVLCGLVNKPNPMGKQLLRELILTSRKRLIYVDSQSLEIKGEIDWVTENGVDHFVKITNPTTFEVHHSMDKKIYKFITKDDLTAQHWVDAINAVKKPTKQQQQQQRK